MLCFATKMLFMQPCFWITSPQSPLSHNPTKEAMPCSKQLPVLMGPYSALATPQSPVLYIVRRRISSERATEHIFQPVDTLLEKMLSKGFPSDCAFSHHPERVGTMLSSVFQFSNTSAFYFQMGKCQTPFHSLCVAGCVHV